MSAALQRIVIVGASSGIGEALAIEMAVPGRSIGLIARRQTELEAVAAKVRAKGAVAVVDVSDASDIVAVEQSWSRISAALGGVDAIVYSSGAMADVGPDEFSSDKDKWMIEVNVIGAMSWLNCAARGFSAQGHGTICGIGSVAGDRGRRPNPAYGASKAALHSFLESLRNRLTHRGIRVVTIKPGPVATPMTAHLPEKPPFLIDAPTAAKRIAKAIENGEHTVYVPGIWRFIMLAMRCTPSFLFVKFTK